MSGGPLQQRPTPQGLRPVAFFDRDGVLNHDSGFIFRAEDFRWMAGAREALRLVNQRGYLAVVITNQSGVARGLYSEAQVHALHAWVAGEAARAGAEIAAFYHCPHHPEGTVAAFRRACDCRKPAPGMLLRAFAELGGRKEGSFLVGDRESDLEAAQAAGVPGHLFTGGDLLQFVQKILPV